MARARACLTQVREHDPAAWQAGLARMRATFAVYWLLAGGRAAGQYVPPHGLPSADGPALPPPPPPRGSLDRFDTPFVKLARGVVYQLRPVLDTWVPFHEPVPEPVPEDPVPKEPLPREPPPG